MATTARSHRHNIILWWQQAKLKALDFTSRERRFSRHSRTTTTVPAPPLSLSLSAITTTGPYGSAKPSTCWRKKKETNDENIHPPPTAAAIIIFIFHIIYKILFLYGFHSVSCGHHSFCLYFANARIRSLAFSLFNHLSQWAFSCLINFTLAAHAKWPGKREAAGRWITVPPVTCTLQDTYIHL